MRWLVLVEAVAVIICISASVRSCVVSVTAHSILVLAAFDQTMSL
jgi:hypothetical protein